MAKKPPAKKKKKPGLSPKQIDHIEQDYGLSYALFKAFPELNRLLGRAVKGAWTAQKFQVELRQSKWFKTHSDVWRKNTALQYSDPASYNQRITAAMPGLNNIAQAMGVSLSAASLRAFAQRSLLFGWDEAQARDVFAAYVKPSDNGEYGGDLAAAQRSLETTAYKNGIKLTASQLDGYMKNIARGDGSQDQYENGIRDMAAKTFSLYGDQIQGGADLYDVASPYMQSMASTLELNPNELDLFDPTIRSALTGVQDDKGVYQPQTITAFENTLRKDKRWQYTKTANEQARGYVSALSQAWGLG